MKLSTNGVDSVTYGEVETNKFGFIFNGKMAEILSSKLYTDKYYAPVRELICNARDAHVAAGNADKPFIVHLPCQSEPYFSVRDFGIGLTHEDVVRIFTQYGATTKDDTNDAIGCLGLGSKSPFAYTDAFQVKAYKNGICNTYLCSKESGIPEDTLFGTCKTDEPDGVEVKFEVNPSDFSSFAEKLKKMFFLKDYMTVVDKLGYFSFPGIPNRLCAVYDFLNSPEHQSCINQTVSVEMGGVIYSVDTNYGDISELDSFKSKLGWRKKVIIHAEIGDIDIAVSREHVELTKKTKTFIKKAIAEFDKLIRGKIYAELNKEPDVFRKLLRYKSLRAVYGDFGRIRSMDRHYDRLCALVLRGSVSSIMPGKHKVASSCLYNDLQGFGNIAEKLLRGDYPIFLDLVGKQIIPPEVRRAVADLGKAIHCIRSSELLGLCKKLNIPVHALSEYAQYKPVRAKAVRRENSGEERPKSLNTTGFFTNNFYRLADIKRAYEVGRTIYWLTEDQGRELVKIPKVVNRIVPKSLQLADSYSYRYDTIMQGFHNACNAFTVHTTNAAAEKRAKNNSQFTNFKEAVTSLLKDRERVQKAVDGYICDVVGNKLQYLGTYGEPLCKVLIELVNGVFAQDRDCYVDVIPHIKKALSPSSDRGLNANVPELDMAIIEQFFGYAVRSVVNKFDREVNKIISEEIPLLKAVIDDNYGKVFDLSYYSKEVQEEANEYLRLACKRLTKKLKEIKNNSVTNNNNENKEN